MAGKIQLSARLQAIADMVTECNRLVDVGCDHGYLPIYLVQNNKIPHAIAADVRTGPLDRARIHISQCGLDDFIETRLSDGLKNISRTEGDTLVVAGMGGPLMEKILSEGAEVICEFKEFILQPQSDVAHFRHYLLTNNLEIIHEEMIMEDGKFYPIMKAKFADEQSDLNWTLEEEYFGKFLLNRLDPVLKEYLNRELRIRKSIIDKLQSASGDKQIKRRSEVEEEEQLIRTALRRYEGK